MIKRDYNNYDYITVSVKEEKYDPIISCYEKLGWERVKSREDAVYYNLMTVVFRRPHKIMKKDRLQLLQVWMETQINEISSASEGKHAGSTLMGFFLYLLYACMVISGALMLAMTVNPILFWVGIALIALGVIGATATVVPIIKKVKRENIIYEERVDKASSELEKHIAEADALAYERDLYQSELLRTENQQFEEQLNQSIFDEQDVDEKPVDKQDVVDSDEQDALKEDVESEQSQPETDGEKAFAQSTTEAEEEIVNEQENIVQQGILAGQNVNEQPTEPVQNSVLDDEDIQNEDEEKEEGNIFTEDDGEAAGVQVIDETFEIEEQEEALEQVEEHSESPADCIVEIIPNPVGGATVVEQILADGEEQSTQIENDGETVVFAEEIEQVNSVITGDGVETNGEEGDDMGDADNPKNDGDSKINESEVEDNAQ